MRLSFTKMQGLGNDFVVIDDRAGGLEMTPALARGLADRRLGVGCDQVLVLGAPRSPGSDLAVRILNADGSEAEQCGNGMRCLALLAGAPGGGREGLIVLDTPAGVVRARLLGGAMVSVEMGVPRLEPRDIPFVAPQRAPSYPLSLNGEEIRIGAVSLGNPHAVLQVQDVDGAAVERLGPLVQRHPRWPRGANVGFMQVLAPDRIRLRVYERGAGETLACGSGACAAVVAGRVLGLLAAEVAVDLRGGRLQVRWPGEGEPLWMTGPACRVFEGTIEI